METNAPNALETPTTLMCTACGQQAAVTSDGRCSHCRFSAGERALELADVLRALEEQNRAICELNERVVELSGRVVELEGKVSQ